MAIDLCSSKTPPLTSPRISFSHDLSQSDIHEQRLLRSFPVSSSSSIDFDFCIRESSFNQQSSCAEELFSQGKILPIDPKSNQEPPLSPLDHTGDTNASKCNQNSNETTVSVLSESHDTSKCNQNSNETTVTVLESHDTPKCHQNSNEITVSVSLESHDTKQKSSKSSFWQFKRSSSLNCGTGYVRTLCPIPLLSRSKSTGSTSSSKKSLSSPRDVHANHKQHPQKNSVLVAQIKKSQFSHQKPPLKKNGYGSLHGTNNGVRVSPVLNVPSADFFGLSSIFSGNKEKNKK